MKKIKLKQGQDVLVDDEDYEYLSQWKWWCDKNNYAIRCSSNTTYRMHRIITKAPKGLQVDHIDGNPLNNQKINLRVCTAQQNQSNRKKQKSKYSKYKGVSWHKRNKKWIGTIQFNNTSIHLGYFKEQEDAAKAYNEAAIKYFGEYAKLNKINQKETKDGNE